MERRLQGRYVGFVCMVRWEKGFIRVDIALLRGLVKAVGGWGGRCRLEDWSKDRDDAAFHDSWGRRKRGTIVGVAILLT